MVNLLDSQMLSWQGYAKFALHEGFHDLPFPSLAVRARLRLPDRHRPGRTSTPPRLDVLVSKGFGVLKTAAHRALWRLEPAHDQSQRQDHRLHPAVRRARGRPSPARASQSAAGAPSPRAATTDDFKANYAFPSQDIITRYRVFGGAKLKFGVLAVIAQYELYLAGHSRDDIVVPAVGVVSAVDQSGQQSAFSLSTGLEF